MVHVPVLTKEVIEYLDPKSNENFIDATFGGGGHALEILKRNGPRGKVLGIDWDAESVKSFEAKERLILINDSYTNLKDIVKRYNLKVNGIHLDLGMSSWHLEKSGRGFSFLKDEPLDMRYSDKNDLTAGKIVNQYSEKEIERILREYGEEKFSRKIAEKIVKARPIKSTFQLVKAIKMPQKGRIHWATRTFQALRIAVNDELVNLEKVLPRAVEVLASGGRLAVISFHSLEDRIVKNFFKSLSSEDFKILTKKPIKASQEEVKDNPRSRSAKLRAIKKNKK